MVPVDAIVTVLVVVVSNPLVRVSVPLIVGEPDKLKPEMLFNFLPQRNTGVMHREHKAEERKKGTRGRRNDDEEEQLVVT